jgi:hypothetical protein
MRSVCEICVCNLKEGWLNLFKTSAPCTSFIYHSHDCYYYYFELKISSPASLCSALDQQLSKVLETTAKLNDGVKDNETSTTLILHKMSLEVVFAETHIVVGLSLSLPILPLTFFLFFFSLFALLTFQNLLYLIEAHL